MEPMYLAALTDNGKVQAHKLLLNSCYRVHLLISTSFNTDPKMIYFGSFMASVNIIKSDNCALECYLMSQSKKNKDINKQQIYQHPTHKNNMLLPHHQVLPSYTFPSNDYKL